MKIIKGRVLQFIDNPFKVEINQACNFFENGAVAINGKYIADINIYSLLSKKYPNAEVFDFANDIICAGFIDCHMHYPQTGIIASYGKRLIDWLNTYTFPEEISFKEKKICKKNILFYLK